MHPYTAADTRYRAYGLLATLAVAIAWLTNALAGAVGLGPAWWVSSPAVAGAFYLLYEATDARAWRWPALRRTGFVSTPILGGTYQGFLVSSWDRARQIPVTLVISQRWTSIYIEMSLPDQSTSRSQSVAAALEGRGHNGAHLTYTYKNLVQPATADLDMHDHDGSADLDFDLSTGQVTGRYFNARGRTGGIRLRRA